MSYEDFEYDHEEPVMMGHAYKILILFKNGDHEVLHYTSEDAANEAFDSLTGFSSEGLSFVKLYKPTSRYGRSRG